MPATSRRKKTPRGIVRSSNDRPSKASRSARATKHKTAPCESAPLNLSINWIRSLAEPYLRGYRAKPERADGLRGYYFSLKPAARGSGALGFFVGFLGETGAFAHLRPAAPECLIFAFIDPTGGPLHRAQVRDPKGTLRWTSGYIAWLTHRPPKFQFYETERTALIRHASMRAWPAEEIQHLAGNFFTETLAWLVRSGLVRRWRELSAAAMKN
ncbi:MAG: hypothetical protein WAM91_17880 [Candidatus Acidiferrales bacterium]